MNKLIYEKIIKAKERKIKRQEKRAKLWSQKKTKRKKPWSLKRLKKEADRVFSVWIRNRDSIDGIATCCTCGARMPWQEIQNGHFVSRKHFVTRWDERNCAAQCAKCNGPYGKGEEFLFGQFIDKKYGEGTAKKLKNMRKTISPMKRHDFEKIINRYRLNT